MGAGHKKVKKMATREHATQAGRNQGTLGTTLRKQTLAPEIKRKRGGKKTNGGIMLSEKPIGLGECMQTRGKTRCGVFLKR